jgi:hypothetical protein
VAPGIASFAFALDECDVFRPIAARILHDVRDGVPLRALLDRALQAWAHSAPEYADLVGAHGFAVWVPLIHARGAARSRLLQQQRLLLRRAGPAVPPTLLLLPPPLRFAPEDIPTAVRANARWFRVVKGTRRAMATADGIDPAFSRDFSAFVSAHSGDLGHGTPTATRRLIRRLFTYCRATGRHPRRTTAARPLVEATLAWSKLLLGLADEGIESGPDAWIPAEILASLVPVHEELRWSTDHVRVRLLRTIGDYLAEGERMHHCAGRLVDGALRGEFVLCHADVGPVGGATPVTVRLERVGRAWAMTDLRGVANARPDDAVVKALRPWMDAVGVEACWVEYGEDAPD